MPLIFAKTVDFEQANITLLSEEKGELRQILGLLNGSVGVFGMGFGSSTCEKLLQNWIGSS